jgi:hypothetical protein
MEKYKLMSLRAWHEKKHEKMPLIVPMWMCFYYFLTCLSPLKTQNKKYFFKDKMFSII